MKLLLLVGLLSFNVMADSVRGDNLSCTNSDSSPFSIEAGVGVGSERDDYYYDDQYNNYNDNQETTFNLNFKYEFGGPKRLNCDALYSLLLREKEAELQMLEAKIAALKGAASINWD